MAKAISRISDLIIKHLKEELTEEESHELQNWVHLSEENAVLFNQLTDADNLAGLLQESHQLKESIRKKIDARIAEFKEDQQENRPFTLSSSDKESIEHASSDHPHSDYIITGQDLAEVEEGRLIYLPGFRRSKRKVWLYAAAACLLGLSAGAYFWMTRPSHSSPIVYPLSLSKNDVAPGSDKAILTLANGSTIVLENAANGSLAVEGNSRISKDKNSLAYTTAKADRSGKNSSGAPTPLAVVYNTLTTPRAGQFRVTLPDGSKVWLNNASSLRYPTSFTGKSREVSLSGEAYFEITKDAAKPFTVKLADLAVDVLGTSFNIMAYGDDPTVRTTLLTGKVSVTGNGKIATDAVGKTASAASSKESGKQAFLSPGEQAVISQEGNWKILKGVDTNEAIAWQRGYFHFNHEDIGDVLRQLGRWYDVEVEFTIPVPDYTFDGEIGRDLSLSSILAHLEKKDLHFRIDGKKLIVSK